MSSSPTVRSGGVGFFGLLAIVFITLKLLNMITWSWWLVLAPLWAPFVAVLGIFVIAFFVILISSFTK